MAKGLLIGVGQPFRRDDGIGPKVAEQVRSAAPPGVDVICHHGEGTDLMERWRGYGRVVIVDACRSGRAPGSIHCWDAVAAPLPIGILALGSHQFGVAEAIEMARLLDRLPQALTVIGVEAADFADGKGLSPAVATAQAEAAALAVRLLDGALPDRKE